MSCETLDPPGEWGGGSNWGGQSADLAQGSTWAWDVTVGRGNPVFSIELTISGFRQGKT